MKLTAFTLVKHPCIQTRLAGGHAQETAVFVCYVVGPAYRVGGVHAVNGTLAQGPPIRPRYAVGPPRTEGLFAGLCKQRKMLVEALEWRQN